MNFTDDISWFAYPTTIEYWPLVLVILGTVVSGVLIGAIGVGGVAIVPMLLFFGVDGKIAVTSAMFAYIFVAVSAIVVHGKRTAFSRDNVRQLLILCCTSFPTALLAGYVLTLISANVAVLICASLALITSLKTLVEFGKDQHKKRGRCLKDSKGVRENDVEADAEVELQATSIKERSLSTVDAPEEQKQDNSVSADASEHQEPAPEVVSTEPSDSARATPGGCSNVVADSLIFTYVGVITGFGSGLTGTSGPVVAIPQIFLTRPKLSSFMAVAYSVIVQLPIALGSTTGNFIFGQMDLGLGVMLGVLLAAACPFGVAISSRLNDTVIKVIVSILLVVAAGVLFGNTIPKMIAINTTTATSP